MAGALAAILAIAFAASARSVCHPAQTEVAARPIPPPLAPAVIAAFEVRMTPAEVMDTGVVRCADGHLLACLVGANLNCAKADTRTSNSGANNWCRDHADSDFVPAFATGHDTIYAWRCNGTHAVITQQVQHVDRQGFVAENWKRVGG
jgi:hypothetical protein